VGRILAWLLGAIGLAGLAKALRKRHPAPPPAAPDPRADELRRRLEEAKPLASEPHDEGGTPIDEAPDPAPARTREDVHAQARAATEAMRRAADDGGETAPDTLA
jgi:hypothetical protein